MQHTLLAVFDNRADAKSAMDDLLASGFAQTDVRLSEGGQGAGADDQSLGSGIKNFFSDIFGTDRAESAHLYSEAVRHGNFVLTVSAAEEREIERAADVVERHGPVDIDEQRAQWGMGEQMRTGAVGAQQQSQSASQQFAGGQADQQVAGTAKGSAQRAAADTTAIPVVQEELKVGKREVQRGGVRVFKRVVETPVDESVDLREENVSVQRRPVDKPVDPADASAFQETSFEVRETAEEAVPEKTARIVEEVVVGKDVTQRQEKISDTVRRTEVEVEDLSGGDDSAFRKHWSSNFAQAGGTYDDYAPAYRYGSQMRNSERYRGRSWDDVQSDLRSDWETSQPGRTWDKFKAAVREGWNRISS